MGLSSFGWKILFSYLFASRDKLPNIVFLESVKRIVLVFERYLSRDFQAVGSIKIFEVRKKVYFVRTFHRFHVRKRVRCLIGCRVETISRAGLIETLDRKEQSDRPFALPPLWIRLRRSRIAGVKCFSYPRSVSEKRDVFARNRDGRTRVKGRRGCGDPTIDYLLEYE